MGSEMCIRDSIDTGQMKSANVATLCSSFGFVLKQLDIFVDQPKMASTAVLLVQRNVGWQVEFLGENIYVLCTTRHRKINSRRESLNTGVKQQVASGYRQQRGFKTFTIFYSR